MAAANSLTDADLDDLFDGVEFVAPPAVTDADIDDMFGDINLAPMLTKSADPAKPLSIVATAMLAATAAEESKMVETPDSKAAAAEFTLSSIKDHAKKKGMWAGALTPIHIADLIGAVPVAPEDPEDPEELKQRRRLNITLVDIDRPHTPALLKILDEIIVNATDHAKGHEKSPPNHRVTRIDIEFDRQTGAVSVYNDGPGIPIVTHAEATRQAGRPVYVVEVAFAWFLAGTNFDKDLTNVKGGINGLGAKIANVHSTLFVVETVDGATRRHYRQEFRNRLDEICPPTITSLAEARTAGFQSVPHTKVSFTPAYKELGYRVDGATQLLSKPDSDDLAAWLCLRAHQAAAYVGVKVNVTFNGEPCTTTDAASLGQLLLTPFGEDAGRGIVLSTVAKATDEPYKQHPWNIAVVVLPPGKRVGRRAAAQNMTIVNGVLSNKGSHVQYIKKLLSAAVEDKLRRATKRKQAPKTGSAATKVLAAAKKGPAAKTPTQDRRMSITETLAGVRLVMCGAIPGADWGGQRKDELQVSRDVLERYTMTATFLRQVGDAVAERILLAQGGNRSKVVHDKYTKARNAGRAAHKGSTLLMAAEGDSAITLLRAGLTQVRNKRAVGPGGPTLDWCGIISLQGVNLNAARQVSSMETSGGNTINIRSAKLDSNKRLLALADAFGLRYDRTYTKPEELATLNYGKLLLCVDQDLDGAGKIAPLVLVWIFLFWPALIEAGRVGRFMTPLVRAYPKRAGAAAHGAKPPTTPIEFYYEEELDRWLQEDPTRAQSYRIKYYKGLATHDDDEVKQMFLDVNFRKSIYVYTMDDGAKRLFNVYFGPDSNLRKDVLVSPVLHLSYDEAIEFHRRRMIPVGRVQLDIDAKSYKNDAIKRQIPGAADGLNPARRKILLGAMMRFGNEASGKELKVFQLGGYVADKCFYHHGDTSLNGTIIYMAQSFPGARKYPYLIGVGQFGSRHGDKAGSPRYISVKLSPFAKAVFPPADRWHLPYVFEDGERAEPRYFIPVVPMASLESGSNISEGWSHDSFGRDMDATLAIAEAYISGDPDLTAAAQRLHTEGATASVMAEIGQLAKTWFLPPSVRDFDGEVRHYRGETWSFGFYTWDESSRTVVITELPIGVATARYLETLVKPGANGRANPRAEYIEEIEDCSTSTKVELVITLRPGAYARIAEAFGDTSIDPIEDVLLLRASMRPHLNYYSAAGAVLEFGECYLANVLYWAPLRRVLYLERLTREHIVGELRVLEEEEIVRYIGIAVSLDLARVQDDAVAAEALRSHKFLPLNKGLLHRPEYTPNETLRELVLSGPGASYDYILDLRERDLVLTSVARRQKILVGLRANLERVNAQLAERPVPGASVWRAEIVEFQKMVARGIETSWKFK